MSDTNLNKITVIVNGAFGKMGQESVKAIQEDPSLDLIAQLGKDDDLTNTLKQLKPDVVVDFTNADSVFQNTKDIISHHCSPVIGSSGLLESQIDELKILSKEYNTSGIIVPNFSLGAVLMMHFSSIAAKFFDYCEITERHHPNKLDAPSGTAIRTADVIAENISTNNFNNNKSKEIIPSALGANYKNIPIHSLRLSGSCAHQTVLFGGLDETLTIQHDSMHRKSFMPGVVLACKKVKTLDNLCIGLENLLNI